MDLLPLCWKAALLSVGGVREREREIWCVYVCVYASVKNTEVFFLYLEKQTVKYEKEGRGRGRGREKRREMESTGQSKAHRYVRATHVHHTTAKIAMVAKSVTTKMANK